MVITWSCHWQESLSLHRIWPHAGLFHMFLDTWNPHAFKSSRAVVLSAAGCECRHPSWSGPPWCFHCHNDTARTRCTHRAHSPQGQSLPCSGKCQAGLLSVWGNWTKLLPTLSGPAQLLVGQKISDLLPLDFVSLPICLEAPQTLLPLCSPQYSTNSAGARHVVCAQ